MKPPPADTTTTHESSFAIHTPCDFLQKMILPQYEDFMVQNGSSRHALLVIILAFHMYEWVHRTPFGKDHFKCVYPNELEMAGLFQLAKGIVNGTKHFIPTVEHQHRTKTRVQTGFPSAFSDAFARPLNVEFSDGTRISADIVVRKTVEFWKRQKRLGAF